MLCPHEITPGGGHFHTCHGNPRHSRDGFDHPRPAEADSGFSRRGDDERGEVEREIRGGLRPDAVFLFAVAWSFVRSIWKTACHPALKSRSRPGLYNDAETTELKLAFPRPNYFR